MESPMTATDVSPQQNHNDRDAAPAGVVPFPVSPDSPFADGYDIAAERDALADLVAAGHSAQDDPRWARFVELRERENELREAARNEIRDLAPAAAVVVRGVSSVAKLGQLADATPDTMTLHTKDAYRMFTGRLADAAANLPHIPGGRRFAAILKSIWHLSANDNPYADWILVRMYDGLVAIRNHLDRVITAREEAFDLLKRKGLTLSVMGSRPTAMPRQRRSSSSTTTCGWSRPSSTRIASATRRAGRRSARSAARCALCSSSRSVGRNICCAKSCEH